MNLRRVVHKRIRHKGKGVNALADLNAVIAANVGETGSKSHISSRSKQRIVQRSGRTEVTEERQTSREGGADEPTRGTA
jgi:hypothetical protein